MERGIREYLLGSLTSTGGVSGLVGFRMHRDLLIVPGVRFAGAYQHVSVVAPPER